MSCLRRGNLSGHQKNGYRLTSAVATLSLADGWQIDSMAFAMMIVLSSMEIIKSFELSLSVSYCSRNLYSSRYIRHSIQSMELCTAHGITTARWSRGRLVLQPSLSWPAPLSNSSFSLQNDYHPRQRDHPHENLPWVLTL